MLCRKEKGFARVFLVLAALWTRGREQPKVQHYTVLHNWVSESITVITYLSESLYILSALNTLFARYVRIFLLLIILFSL